MNDRSDPRPLTVSIAAVERDTGLSKDTLRVWERRYGFPQPLRDDFGERAYPIEQLEKLRVVKRLMDVGHRPGRIMTMPLEDLRKLAEESNKGTAPVDEQAFSSDIEPFMALIKSHKIADLRHALSQSLLRLGLGRFVTDISAPLAAAVGTSWMRGELQIFEEHLFTECLNGVLRHAIGNAPQTGRVPRALFTTIPNEPHGIGLLMAEAMFTVEGCDVIPLGVQTPVPEIVLAANSQRCHIVALSFSACLNPNSVLDALMDLRMKLSPDIQIWAGGSCPVLYRKPLHDIVVLRNLPDIAPAVRRWRLEHGQS